MGIEITPGLVEIFGKLDYARSVPRDDLKARGEARKAIDSITADLRERYFDAISVDGQEILGIKLAEVNDLIVEIVDKRKGLTLERAKRILDLTT